MNSWDKYRARLDQYGTDRTERIINRAQKNFDCYVKSSFYKTSFILNGEEYFATLEPNKFDDKQSSAYLLVQLDLEIPNGTVLNIEDTKWLVLEPEDVHIHKGYIRYKTVKVTTHFKWRRPDAQKTKVEYESDGCIFGSLTAVIKSMFDGPRSSPPYATDDKTISIIMPFSSDLLEEDYMVISDEGYKVTGYDKVTVPGVMYVTALSIRKKDESVRSDSSGTDDFWAENL